MKYWLMKSEPDAFSIDDLMDSPKETTHWDGIRNYQARNIMRDQMETGDLAFFYHSNCKPPAIVGIMETVSGAYPDHTAMDPNSKYYDPKSTSSNPRWLMRDFKFIEKFSNPISLETLKNTTALSNMKVTQKGNRLSITPVTNEEWNTIIQLSKHHNQTT